MALYGIVADIHGNREALAAVLAALERRGIQRLACLGDIVGYNADPDECVALLQSRGAQAIAGNHDLIGLKRLGFSRCSNKAWHALRRTRRTLSPGTRAYLEALPATLELGQGIVLVHGGVRDVQQYMVAPALIAQNARFLREDFPAGRLCFFGHSHEQKVYRVDGEAVRELAPGREHRLDPGAVHFVNPGSVDASRKRGEKLAECAVLDSEAWRLEFLRLPYDAASTEAKAAAFGYRLAPWEERLYALGRTALRLAARTAGGR